MRFGLAGLLWWSWEQAKLCQLVKSSWNAPIVHRQISLLLLWVRYSGGSDPAPHVCPILAIDIPKLLLEVMLLFGNR